MVPRTHSAANGHAEHPRGGGKAGPRQKQKFLKEVLELQEVPQKDGSPSRYTIRPVEDSYQFDKGFYVFVRALQLLKSHNDGVITVGLAGPSGSGKTSFSERIKSFMPGVVVISMDMYNDGSKIVHQNFDDPRLTDYDCLLANLKDLREGRATEVPIYDFKQSKRVGYTHVEPPEGRVVILEGIYALHGKIRPLLDLRVSITGGVHFDLLKRVMRDMQRAGQDAEAIIQQITETVYPMYKAFIEPDLQTAQLKINNSFNPFSGFLTPHYILKSQAVPDLDLIRTQMQALGPMIEIRDKDLADIYLLPPGEDPETCVTWLRMRNKDGRYTLMFEEWVTEEPFIISPRISFEVNVRILGGLMALGYEIGAILKRTSHIFKSGDVTLKVDDVDNLGMFVQILGQERGKVAQLGTALGLEGTYIARSYIEQIQLQQLTSEFATVAAEVRERLTTTENSTQVLDDVLSASPATRIPRRIPRAAASEPLDMGASRDISCSAPADVAGSRGGSVRAAQSAQRGNAAAMSPSQLTNALNSTQQPTHTELSSTATSRLRPVLQDPAAHHTAHHTAHHNGTLAHHHSTPVAHHRAIDTTTPYKPNEPLTQHSGFQPSPDVQISRVLGQHGNNGGQGRSSSKAPSRVGSIGHLLAASGGSNGALSAMVEQQGGGGGGVGAGSGGVPRVVTDQLDRQLQLIHQSVDQYSDLKVQVDALVGQYQETHRALQQLSQANTQLAHNMKELLTALATRQPGPAQSQQPGSAGVGGWAQLPWVAMSAGVAAGVAAVAVVMLSSRASTQRSS